jgi:hypothetical protein
VHGRIGARLEQAFGLQASEVMLPLALHFEQAGQAERAIPHLMNLAAAANRLGATEGASRHLARASSVLHTVPPSPARDAREAELLMRLGGTLPAGRKPHNSNHTGRGASCEMHGCVETSMSNQIEREAMRRKLAQKRCVSV